MKMKRLFCLVLCLLPLSTMAQGILDRFTDPEKGATVFIEKGHWALGITGGYRSFQAGGEKSGDGFSILSLLNIGDGSLMMYNVSPSFSYFLADDLSLGVRLDYSGYYLDTNLKLDFRELINLDFLEDEEMQQEIGESLNMQISGRHMVRNAWGGSLALRKYFSFFGSKTFAVFGEARLYGDYGLVLSSPIDRMGEYVEKKTRTTYAYAAGIKLAAGLCVKLRDNSALTVSLPLLGAVYQYTSQYKLNTGNTAHMSSFNISRDLDYVAIQIGYVHYLKSKKH